MRNAARGTLLLLSCLVPSMALAQPSPGTPPATPSSSLGFPSATLVVLITDEPGDAVSARLERDLGSLGLSVMLLRATPENSSDSAALERCARGFGGIAAIHIGSGARGSELWVFEPATQRTLTRSLARPVGTDTDPNEVALGTLELLRASLMELHPAPRRLSPPPDAPAAKPANQSGAQFSLSGAFAVELGLRSVGPALATSWSAWFRIRDCFGARGFVTIPLLSEKAEFPEGRVEVEPLIFGAGLACTFAHGSAQVWPRMSLGVAGTHVATRGTASDPSRSHSGAVWLGGGFGMLGLGLRLSRDVHLNLDATGVLLPTPGAIMVAQRQVGTWGAPGGVVSLGVEVLTGL